MNPRTVPAPGEGRERGLRLQILRKGFPHGIGVFVRHKDMRALTVQQRGLPPESEGGSPAGIEAHFCAGECRIPHSAADRFTLKLRKDHQETLHCLPHRCAGLKALCVRGKGSALRLKQRQQGCEIGEIAADAVELIDEHAGNLPCTDLREHLLQGGAVGVLA